jgi:outer membrane protein OmpA-like peptidoglycan-associated protein/opacity protein-like surface antigen
MQHFQRHPWPRMAACTFLALAPLLAQADALYDGPYVSAQGGLNYMFPQLIIQRGNNVDALHFHSDWAAGLAGGYAFANGLRPELELNFRRNYLSHDAFGFGAGGREDATGVLANVWYDFKAPTGWLSFVHPYLGAGLGGVRFDTRGVDVSLGRFADDYAVKLAYQGGAGVAFELFRNLSLTTDYRYLQTYRGSFLFGSPAGHDRLLYRAQSAMLGLRYSFGAPPAAPLPPQPPIDVVPVEEPPPPPPPPSPPPCNPPAGFMVDADCHIVEQSVVVRAVDFEFNKALLTAPAQQTLDEIASALAAQPELRVEIQGHTDSIGSAPYNLKLSQQRADAVKSYLVSKGVDGATLSATGFGKAHPIASNATAEGRAENRRVEFEVSNAPAQVKVQTESATSASTDAALEAEQPKAAAKPAHKPVKKAKKKAAVAPAAAPAANAPDASAPPVAPEAAAPAEAPAAPPQ